MIANLTLPMVPYFHELGLMIRHCAGPEATSPGKLTIWSCLDSTLDSDGSPQRKLEPEQEGTMAAAELSALIRPLMTLISA